MEAAALTFVLDFLKSAFSEVFRDQLRTKTSLEKARDLSYSLVDSLSRLKRASGMFAAYLAEAATGPVPLDARLREQISSSLEEVSSSLLALAEIMNRIDPQLEVHAPEVAEQIYSATQSRSMVISDVQEQLLDSISSLDPMQIREMSEEANRVQREIEEVSEELRKFVAKSIGYKESF